MKVSRSKVKRYEKIDRVLGKMVISFFIILIMVQWYLRIFNRGIEPLLNKLYMGEGLRFKVIDVVTEDANVSN